MTAATTTKTYTPLAQIPKAYIGKCSALLPNRMQCWRAGDVLVSITITVPATEEDTEAVSTISTYQLCYAHSAQEQYRDTIAAKAAEDLATAEAEIVAASTSVPEAPTPANAPVPAPAATTPTTKK